MEAVYIRNFRETGETSVRKIKKNECMYVELQGENREMKVYYIPCCLCSLSFRFCIRSNKKVGKMNARLCLRRLRTSLFFLFLPQHGERGRGDLGTWQ